MSNAASPGARTAVILQSSYIPWKGYFDLIYAADDFILFDDVQYTRRDWRNRNRIRTANGTQWLTIPVAVKGRYHQSVRDTRISDPAWAKSHWQRLRQAYAQAPYFDRYRERFEALYLGMSESSLSLVNRAFIEAICEVLGIKRRITWSMDYPLLEGRTERLVGLCRSTGATRYLSGPSARDYIDPVRFEEAGIQLAYFGYDGYPEYPQVHGGFEHAVSILDLIFNTGPDAVRYMKCAKA